MVLCVHRLKSFNRKIMTKSTYARENLRIIHIKENAIIKHAFKDAEALFYDSKISS